MLLHCENWKAFVSAEKSFNIKIRNVPSIFEIVINSLKFLEVDLAVSLVQAIESARDHMWIRLLFRIRSCFIFSFNRSIGFLWEIVIFRMIKHNWASESVVVFFWPLIISVAILDVYLRLNVSMWKTELLHVGIVLDTWVIVTQVKY